MVKSETVWVEGKAQRVPIEEIPPPPPPPPQPSRAPSPAPVTTSSTRAIDEQARFMLQQRAMRIRAGESTEGFPKTLEEARRMVRQSRTRPPTVVSGKLPKSPELLAAESKQAVIKQRLRAGTTIEPKFAVSTRPRSVLLPVGKEITTFKDAQGRVVGIEDPVAKVSMAVTPQPESEIRFLEQQRATGMVQELEIKRGPLTKPKFEIEVKPSLIPGFAETKKQLLENVQAHREVSQQMLKRGEVLTELGQKQMAAAPVGQPSFEGLGYSLKGVALTGVGSLYRGGVEGAEVLGRFEEIPVFLLKAPFELGAALIYPRRTFKSIKETLAADPGAAVGFAAQLAIFAKAHAGLVELIKPPAKVKVRTTGKSIVLETERAAFGAVGEWHQPTISEIVPIEPKFTFGRGYVFAEGAPTTVLTASEFVFVPPGVEGPVIQVGDAKVGVLPQELGKFIEKGSIKVISGPEGELPKVKVGEFARRGFVIEPVETFEPALAGIETQLKLRGIGKSITEVESFRKLEQAEFLKPAENIAQWKRISSDFGAEGISGDLWRIELPGRSLTASAFAEEAATLDPKFLKRIKKFDYGTSLLADVKEPFITAELVGLEDFSYLRPAQAKAAGVSDFIPSGKEGLARTGISQEGLSQFGEFWQQKYPKVSGKQSRALTDLAQDFAKRSPAVDFAAELALSDKAVEFGFPPVSITKPGRLEGVADITKDMQGLGERLLPAQDLRQSQALRPMQHLRPSQALRPMQELRPSQALRPAQDLRPMQELRPIQQLRQLQNLRQLQQLRPLQDIRPGRGQSLRFARPPPPTHFRFALPPQMSRQRFAPSFGFQRRGYFERVFKITTPSELLGRKKSKRKKKR